MQPIIGCRTTNIWLLFVEDIGSKNIQIIRQVIKPTFDMAVLATLKRGDKPSYAANLKILNISV